MLDLQKLVDIARELEAKGLKEESEELILDEILKAVMEIANCEAGTMYLLQPNKKYLGFRVVRNNRKKEFNTYKGDSAFNAIDLRSKKLYAAAIAFKNNEVICIDDVYDKHCKYNLDGPKEYDGKSGYHTKSMFIIPFENSASEVIGCIQLINALDENGEYTSFDKNDENAFRYFALKCAVVLGQIQKKEQMKKEFEAAERERRKLEIRPSKAADDYLSENYVKTTDERDFPAFAVKMAEYLKAASENKKTAVFISGRTGIHTTDISKYKHGIRRPDKEQAILLAIELGLSFEEMREFLMLAGGYELRKTSRRETLIEYFFKENELRHQNLKLKIDDMNDILEKYGEPILELVGRKGQSCDEDE